MPLVWLSIYGCYRWKGGAGQLWDPCTNSNRYLDDEGWKHVRFAGSEEARDSTLRKRVVLIPKMEVRSECNHRSKSVAICVRSAYRLPLLWRHCRNKENINVDGRRVLAFQQRWPHGRYHFKITGTENCISSQWTCATDGRQKMHNDSKRSSRSLKMPSKTKHQQAKPWSAGRTNIAWIGMTTRRDAYVIASLFISTLKAAQLRARLHASALVQRSANLPSLKKSSARQWWNRWPVLGCLCQELASARNVTLHVGLNAEFKSARYISIRVAAVLPNFEMPLLGVGGHQK